MRFNCLKARATSMRQFTFYQTPQKLLVLILPTSEEWKAKSTLELSSGFEHGPLDWESSTLTSRPLKLQKKLPKLLQNLSIYLYIYTELPSNKLRNLVQFLRRTKILKALFNNLAWHKMQWCNVLKSYHQKTAKNLFSRETRNLILYIYLVYGKLVIFNP